MADTVRVRYRRAFPHPVDAAYTWLTDYRDDDPQRGGGVIIKERPVVSRAPDKVVLRGRLEVLGRADSGTAEVDLMPPDRWRARIVEGRGRGSVYEYALEPAKDGKGSRLTVDYHFRARRLKSKLRLWLARPMLMRQLDKMWGNFAASMEADLGPAR